MMPLSGRRVLVTREADDALRWAHRLESEGAVPVMLPCITCEALDGDTPDRLRAAVAACDWIVLSSVRGVEIAAQMLKAPLPEHVRVAVVGPSTAVRAKARLGRVDVVSARAVGAVLGSELAARLAGTSERVLVVGARGGRTDIEDALALSGVARTRVDVYRTLPVPLAPAPRDLVAEGVSDILLASPSAVQGLRNAALIPPDARIITIGPTTTSAARGAGLTVWAEARQPDLDGMLEAIR